MAKHTVHLFRTDVKYIQAEIRDLPPAPGTTQADVDAMIAQWMDNPAWELEVVELDEHNRPRP